jgi:hypothetical protein
MPRARNSLSTAARIDRDRRIVELREVGKLTFPQIAELVGMNERSVRKAYHRALEGVEAGTVPVVDVEGAVHRAISVHLVALGRLETLIDQAAETHAGVGLLRTSSSVALGLLEALRRTGYLMESEGDLRRFDAEFRQLAGELLAAAQRAGLPTTELDHILGLEEELVASIRSGAREGAVA